MSAIGTGSCIEWNPAGWRLGVNQFEIGRSKPTCRLGLESISRSESWRIYQQCRTPRQIAFELDQLQGRPSVGLGCRAARSSQAPPVFDALLLRAADPGPVALVIARLGRPVKPSYIGFPVPPASVVSPTQSTTSS
jgi:hypothetical protein